MGISILIFFVLAVIIIAGIWFLRSNEPKSRPAENHGGDAREVPSECCGAHEVCEFDGLIKRSDEIVYFNDEELDRFAEEDVTAYSDEQIEEIREVLYTLHPSEINSWLHSLDARRIKLPEILNMEARQLLSDYINTSKVS